MIDDDDDADDGNDDDDDDADDDGNDDAVKYDTNIKRIIFRIINSDSSQITKSR